jgi:hypothetical protein
MQSLENLCKDFSLFERQRTMTVSTIDLPREMIQREQYQTDVWYEDLDEETERIIGKRSKKTIRDESEADCDE